ncbi:MAG: hypothetical protein LBT75_02695 [Bacilli bacterium]|jgi:hypothetical protein|nr:hypothetical protein [Bacilli bacterium]
MLFVFNDDGTYYWYRDASNLKDDYYYGQYLLYDHEAAFKKASEISEVKDFKKQYYNQEINKKYSIFYVIELKEKGVKTNLIKDYHIPSKANYLLMALNDQKDYLHSLNWQSQSVYNLSKEKS